MVDRCYVLDGEGIRGTPTDLWFMRRLTVSIEDIENSVEVNRNAKMPAVNNQC
jgi:hypothetical protein